LLEECARLLRADARKANSDPWTPIAPTGDLPPLER
jgi:hypothetical protein